MILLLTFVITVFTVGDTQAACTKGIIAYLTRHPKQPDRHILFLDTEGLGDARKVNKMS